MLTDPAQVKEVFTAPPDVLHPGRGARILKPFIGANSVLVLDESAHMAQRKLLLPAVHGERMERLTGLMEEVTSEELARLPRGVPIELHTHMQDITLRIILRAVFGVDPGARFEALRKRMQGMLKFTEEPISMTPPPRGGVIERTLKRVGPLARFLHTRGEVDELLFELIAERRAKGDDHGDVLAMLLEAHHDDGSPMSEQEIRDELMTLLVAGHETTASSLAWAFERLRHAPRVMERLVDEIDAGEEAYLTATIQETLRRRPVLPNASPRYVAKPVEVGGWAYPTGCNLVPSCYLIHHDPEIYPEPYEFRPERFLGEQPGTYTWIPFGGGRRRCLGASFAMLEMRIVLREVLSTVELRDEAPHPEAALRRNVTVAPSRGSRAVLIDRRRVRAAA